jgi:hypothetical protein
MEFLVDLQWIRCKHGGREHPPVVGLRPMIRVQKRVSEWLEIGCDCDITGIDFNSVDWSSSARIEIRNYHLKQFNRLVGEPIELLDGYRVIAVGLVVSCLNATEE